MVQVTMQRAVIMVVNMVPMIHMAVMGLITIPLYLSVLPMIPQAVTMQMLGLKRLVRLMVECTIPVLSTSVY